MGDASTTTTPSIYIACLAAYNSGYLHGTWMDAAQNEEAIRAEIAAMLARSPIADAEEYAIHDFEGFKSLRISEYEGIASVVRKAAFIIEHGALGAAVAEHFGGDLDEAEKALTERYFGEYLALADFIEESTANAIDVPRELAGYIDWEAMGRDAEISGDVFIIQTANDEVHVFCGC